SALGATNDYTRTTATWRRYQPLGNRLTWADRVLVQDIRGNALFYELPVIQTELKPQDGLGGSSSVRGIPKDRYIGKGLLLGNSVLRWRAADFPLLGRSSSLSLRGFVDGGSVCANGLDTSYALSLLY